MTLPVAALTFGGWLEGVSAAISDSPLLGAGEGVQFFLHIIAALLAVIVVLRCGKSLLRGKVEREAWGVFCIPDGREIPLNHWENTIGRARGCDIVLSDPTVSRNHAAVTRNSRGEWTVFPLNAKNGVYWNGQRIRQAHTLQEEDVLSLGDLDLTFYPSTKAEEREQAKNRAKPGRKVSPGLNLIFVTVFQAILTYEMLLVSEEHIGAIFLSNLLLCLMMWGMYAIYRIGRRTGYEVETLAFFLTSVCLQVTASKFPDTLYKQLGTAFAGIVLFFILTMCLRNIDVAKKLRYPACIGAGGLLVLNLLLAQTQYGAKNWIAIGSFSFQPSELVKICFVLGGMATLDRLFSRRNLFGTVVFSAFCVGCLGLMSDFGTALIFFVAFLVIAFLRTGDLPSVVMVVAAAAFAVVIILNFKPYILERFSIWGHVWDDPFDLGYQQTRTLAAMASGGFFGLGAGQGGLKRVAASSTDLVFGMVTEELGLLVAVSAVAAIVIFALFAVKSSASARSSFYVIGASAVAAMFAIQTMLNVFGCTDLLPLTGVTLPFVSTGGSSMMSCWALLAYIKAADTRQNASFAVRLPEKKKKDEPEGEENPFEDELPPDREDTRQFPMREFDVKIDYDAPGYDAFDGEDYDLGDYSFDELDEEDWP